MVPENGSLFTLISLPEAEFPSIVAGLLSIGMEEENSSDPKTTKDIIFVSLLLLKLVSINLLLLEEDGLIVLDPS